MPRKTAPTPAGATAPSQFRLRPETLADLNYLAESLAESTGVPHTRTDAVRFAARFARAAIEKPTKKKLGK